MSCLLARDRMLIRDGDLGDGYRDHAAPNALVRAVMPD